MCVTHTPQNTMLSTYTLYLLIGNKRFCLILLHYSYILIVLSRFFLLPISTSIEPIKGRERHRSVRSGHFVSFQAFFSLLKCLLSNLCYNFRRSTKSNAMIFTYFFNYHKTAGGRFPIFWLLKNLFQPSTFIRYICFLIIYLKKKKNRI